jgi:hypothetical protein
MKKLFTLLSVLVLAGFMIQDAEAQEQTEVLWLMGEEVVKPVMVNQYFEICKELAELCKEDNFPFSYNVWVSQPFHYLITYYMEEMNDITKIEEAWDKIFAKLGEEKSIKFHECIDSQIDKVMAGLTDLNYVPEPSSDNEGVIDYCYFQEISVKKGSEKAFEEVLKKAMALMKEKGSEMGAYLGKGKTGYDRPVYFAWYFAKDQMDYLEQEKKFAELMGEDWKNINAEVVKHIKGIKNVNYWYIKDLSYEKAE